MGQYTYMHMSSMWGSILKLGHMSVADLRCSDALQTYHNANQLPSNHMLAVDYLFNSVIAIFQMCGSKWPALSICGGHFMNLRDSYSGQQKTKSFCTVLSNDFFHNIFT